MSSESPLDDRNKAADEERQPTKPGAVPLSVSRVDTVAEEFVRLLSRRRTAVGDVLAGRYRVIRELGDGGMGQVFVAENLSIGRSVAIKVLKPDLLANDAFRKRFQKEAEAIAAIEHQNVVRFFDLVVGDPTFLVMEYVDGPTLAAVLGREHRLGTPRAVELARRLCWGLDASHRAGVIHRDVKPSNILLAADAEFGELPKLIDFGVAKTVAKEAPEHQLTRHGQIVGTPHYMSPEQITGADVDARSDVYALGCVLYHMLAGRPPFIGNEEYVVLQQHMERAPEPIHTFLPDAPPELDRLLKRALAKNPSMRFATMQEMARALAEVTRPRGEATTPTEAPTSTNRVYKVARPRATPFALVALGALAVGVAGDRLIGRRASPSTTGVLVASDPAGARVEVDGRAEKETTPLAVALPPGEHVVHLHADGHGDVERHVRLRSGERQLVDITMPVASHRVSVNTAPPAASEYLDGKLVLGTTPTVMDVVDDDFHEVKIERAGYETITQPLKPEDRQSELSFTLEPEKEPRGSLSVDSNAVAQVWVDGVYSGFDTPTLAFRVPVGAHVVELRESAGRRSAPAKITIAKGEAMHLTLSLEKAP